MRCELSRGSDATSTIATIHRYRMISSSFHDCIAAQAYLNEVAIGEAAHTYQRGKYISMQRFKYVETFKKRWHVLISFHRLVDIKVTC